MKELMVMRAAALVIGLSLASGMAFAAPDGRRGNDENTGAQQQKQSNQDRTRRNTKPAANPAPTAIPSYPGVRVRETQNERKRRGVEGARYRNEGTRSARGRNNQVTDGIRDNRRNFGNRSQQRGWEDRNRRQHINVQQYHRNFNAPRRYRAEVYQWRNGSSYRRYGYGQRLPQRYFVRNFWIANFLTYDLFPPPSGYIWVRYGPDALLIDQYTGEIVQVRYGMFYS